MLSDNVAMLSATLAELPPYRVLTHPRARRARLKVSPAGEVEVVVPPRFPSHRVPEFVQNHRDWLLRTLQRIRQARSRWHDHDPLWPEQVHFRFSGECWQVRDSTAPRSGVQVKTARLQVRGKDLLQKRQALQRWLSRAATARLTPPLQQLALTMEASPARLQFRGQRSRWGSCSGRGDIQLNRALVFLPEALVRYVLIHELCHLRHHNHSRQFWESVALVDPEWRQHDRAMRQAWDYVPRWALPFSSGIEVPGSAD